MFFLACWKLQNLTNDFSRHTVKKMYVFIIYKQRKDKILELYYPGQKCSISSRDISCSFLEQDYSKNELERHCNKLIIKEAALFFLKK